MTCRPAILFASLALALMPVSLGAQQMVLEPLTDLDGLAYCDYLHNIRTCESLHVESGLVATGSTLVLNGDSYVVEWMGPGYYLESGVVLEAAGGAAPDLKGQRWVEVYPGDGKQHVSRGWRDRDGNQALSASDTLELDSGAVEVRDVRLHLRVRPLIAKEKGKE